MSIAGEISFVERLEVLRETGFSEQSSYVGSGPTRFLVAEDCVCLEVVTSSIELELVPFSGDLEELSVDRELPLARPA